MTAICIGAHGGSNKVPDIEIVQQQQIRPVMYDDERQRARAAWMER
jgi:hypothetical protein